MNYNPDLPKFLDVLCLPDHEKIPGYLNITCKFEEEAGWEKESGFTFQYLGGKLFFLVYPTLVQFPLGEAATVEEAIEIAKQFLKKWLSLDLKTYGHFQCEVAREIFRLEEEKRKEKERYNKEHLEENKRKIMEALEQYRKKSGKG